jgi:hypothetical protein
MRFLPDIKYETVPNYGSLGAASQTAGGRDGPGSSSTVENRALSMAGICGL